jgi:hypothetical protein
VKEAVSSQNRSPRDTIALLVDIALCGLVIFSFFRPWIQLEMVPVNGQHLNELTIEQYGPDHFMARLIYALYALPVLAIVVISASIFRVTRFVWAAKLLMLLLSGVAFYMILAFHRSDEYNIWMRYGVKISALCSLMLVVREVLWRFFRRSHQPHS